MNKSEAVSLEGANVMEYFKRLTSIYLQIYLHNANEVVDLKNLGIAVSPGTHTLVGIKLSEVCGWVCACLYV